MRRRSLPASTRAATAVLFAVFGAAIGVAACGGGGTTTTGTPAAPSAPATQPATAPASPTGEAPQGVALPAPVEETRTAILEATKGPRWDGLAAQLDPASFSYSFGEHGRPVAYWQRLEEQQDMPVVSELLPRVLSTQPARQHGIYVWPAAFAKPPEQWTAQDRADMRLLYSKQDIQRFEQFGSYIGYRVGIRRDGTWLFYIAGD